MRTIWKMPKTCVIVGCHTGHKPKKGEPEHVNKGTVFDFPEKENDPELRSIWIKFVGRGIDWSPSPYVGICSKHFNSSDIKHGKVRMTLERKNRPIPVHTISTTTFRNHLSQHQLLYENHPPIETLFRMKNIYS